MSALWAIARRETGAQWRSPLAPALLALATALFAWWFLAGIESWTEAAPRFAFQPFGNSNLKPSPGCTNAWPSK